MSLLRKIAVVLAAPLIFVWVVLVLLRYGLPTEPPAEVDAGWWG